MLRAPDLLIRRLCLPELLGLALLCNSLYIGAQDANVIEQQPSLFGNDPLLVDDSVEDVGFEKIGEQERIRELQQTRNQLEYQVDQLEIEFGPYYQGLSEPFLDLAGVLRELGDHEASLELLDRSLHTVRINNGLESIEQMEVLREYVLALSDAGEFEKAEAKQFQLFQTAQRELGSGSDEFLEIIYELRDWHAERFIQAGPNSSVNDLVGAYSLSFNLSKALESKYSVTSRGENGLVQWGVIANRETQDNLLWLMFLDHLLYTHGFHERDNVFQRYGPSLSSRIYARRSSAFANEGAFPGDPGSNYRRGRDRATNLVAMTENLDGTGSINHVLAQVLLADWYTMFGQRTSARLAYIKARELATSPEVRASLERIFSLPSELPVSKLSLDSFYASSVGHNEGRRRDDAERVNEVQEGFIKFTYNINTSGRVHGAKILESNVQKPAQALQTVLRRMRSKPIRPVVGESGFVATEGWQRTVYFDDRALIEEPDEFGDDVIHIEDGAAENASPADDLMTGIVADLSEGA